jgi:hypothetical protein
VPKTLARRISTCLGRLGGAAVCSLSNRFALLCSFFPRARGGAGRGSGRGSAIGTTAAVHGELRRGPAVDKRRANSVALTEFRLTFILVFVTDQMAGQERYGRKSTSASDRVH